MNWVVFSYSLPAKSNSRVTLWRRLRRFGAISPTGGIYVLPAQTECIEAFQWLAQEIQQTEGQAVVMHVEQFEGLTDSQLVELFRQARQEDYTKIEEQATQLEQAISADITAEQRTELQGTLTKLQKQHTDLTHIDYFDCPASPRVAAQLARIAQALVPASDSTPQIKTALIEIYKDKSWVTRPQPHVDRLASIWLIRRFINPQATIRYAHQAGPGEVSFDMNGADFGHTGNLCTFETMIQAFNLGSPALSRLAEIVHEIDLRDERYIHPEISGLEAILKGWLMLDLSDAELEERGLALFEALFAAFSA